MIKRAALIVMAGVVAVAMPQARAGDPDRAYVVVRQIVYPNQFIDQGNVAIKFHSRDIPADFPVLRGRDQLAGHVALKTLLPGRAVPPDAVRAPHLIEAGSTVTVTLTDGALNITMKAVALEDGALGQTIRVRNGRNGRTICAIVRSETMAEVC